MKSNRLIISAILLFLFCGSALGQRPEITLTLNEQFMDAALDAVLQKGEPPSIPLKNDSNAACRESLRLTREVGGVRTAVRFRDGRIFAPIAFNGNYSLPIIGCIDFSGWAETEITLEFDPAGKRILARAKTLNVNLNGAGAVGGNLLTRLVRSSVEDRINPIDLISLERLSFVFPIQGAGNVQLNATGFRHSVQNSSLSIHIPYEIVRN
ncbi:MAG: hypothetical protein ACRD6X_20720 [Pyrinomonadaceae bacterium]